jgi:hypothetical protein
MARSATMMAMILAAGAATAGIPGPAAAQMAQMVCGERVEIVNALQSGHQEKRTAGGLSGSGGLVELFTGDSGTWTLLLTLPGGPTCLLGAGEAWEGSLPNDKAGDIQPRNTSMPVLSDDLI